MSQPWKSKSILPKPPSKSNPQMLPGLLQNTSQNIIENQPKKVSYHYAYTSIHPHMHTFLEFTFKKNNENLILNYSYSGKGCWVCSYKDFYIPFSVFLSIQMRWLLTIGMLKQLFSNVNILWISSGVSIMELFYHLYFNFYVLLYSNILYQ